MDNVEYICSEQEEIVRILEDSLDKARNGYYDYIAFVAVHKKGEMEFAAVGFLKSIDDAFRVTGALGYLSSTLNNNIETEHECEQEYPQV